MSIKSFVILSFIFFSKFFIKDICADSVSNPDEIENTESEQEGEGNSNETVGVESDADKVENNKSEQKDGGNSNETGGGESANVSNDISDSGSEKKEEIYDVTIIRGIKESQEKGVSKEKSDIHVSEGQE